MNIGKQRESSHEQSFDSDSSVQVDLTCADAGVLGMLPGIIGHIQALETVKLIVGIEPNLVGKLLVYDGMKHSMETIEL